MAPDEPIDFFLVPDCSVQPDSFPLDGTLVLDRVIDVVINGGFGDESPVLKDWFIRLQLKCCLV